MTKQEILLTTQIIKEIIRIIFMLIFLIVGFIGALKTGQMTYMVFIFFGVWLIGVGKNPLEVFK